MASAAIATFRNLTARKRLDVKNSTTTAHKSPLAPAYAVPGYSTKSKAVYKDFLTLWKDADPDTPILKQARRSTRSCNSQKKSFLVACCGLITVVNFTLVENC